MTIIEITATQRILHHSGLYIPQWRTNQNSNVWYPWMQRGEQVQFTSESDAHEWLVGVRI